MGIRDVRRAIGERMKWAAAARGWDQPREIVSRMDVSETTVYRWWSGDRQPSDERMEEYAALVGATVEAFFGEHLFEPSISEAVVGVAPSDWLLLTEPERAAVRLTVQGLAKLHRLEEALTAAPRPDGG